MPTYYGFRLTLKTLEESKNSSLGFTLRERHTTKLQNGKTLVPGFDVILDLLKQNEKAIKKLSPKAEKWKK